MSVRSVLGYRIHTFEGMSMQAVFVLALGVLNDMSLVLVLSIATE
jgi:hypothetical protein